MISPSKSVKAQTLCRLDGALAGIVGSCSHIIMLSVLVIWKRGSCTDSYQVHVCAFFFLRCQFFYVYFFPL